MMEGERSVRAAIDIRFLPNLSPARRRRRKKKGERRRRDEREEDGGAETALRNFVTP